MNPSTGTFISMDSYQGSIYDPVSLHKYLYANANPVMYIDPSGYNSIAETETAMGINSVLSGAYAVAQETALSIGMPVLMGLWAMDAVEATAHISVVDMVLLVIDDALNSPYWTDGNDITVEILQYVSDNMEFICSETGIASETITVSLKSAIREAKGKDKKKGNTGKEKGKTRKKKKGNKGGNGSVSTLTNAQKSRLDSLHNTINDHLIEGDFSGILRDLQGNPVPNGKGGYFDHLGEMKDSYTALNKIKRGLEGSLKNPNLSDVDKALLQEGLDKATFYIFRIQEMFKPYGVLNNGR